MILFDLDGVFLSEERCFDISALTVWDILSHPKLLGLAKPSLSNHLEESDLKKKRKEVYQEDRVLRWLKDRGVNSNWDIVYLVVVPQVLRLLSKIREKDISFVSNLLAEPLDSSSLQQIKKYCEENKLRFEPDFSFFFDFYQEPTEEKWNRQQLLEYSLHWVKEHWGINLSSGSRNSSLWKLGRSLYQEWYLGEQLFRETEGIEPLQLGKKGYLTEEIPLATPSELTKLLAALREKGITLGIGTGRSRLEAVVPLEEMGLLQFFDAERIVTASEVVKAEQEFPDRAPLGKPEPFTYLKGYFGQKKKIAEVLNSTLPLKRKQEVLIVGDSVADLLAARKMGCSFAATLTGLNGTKDKELFIELGADYIVDNVTQLLERVFR